MKVSLKLFARARDLAGAETIAVELPEGSTIGDLRVQLCEQHPNLAGLVSSLLFARGTDYVDDSATIDADADLACFPPVSGG